MKINNNLTPPHASAIMLVVLMLNLFVAQSTKADSWNTNSPMITARYSHNAILLTNGKVLVAGGSGGGTSTELYDPVTGIWTNTGAMNNARYAYTATLLTNGQVLVAGGQGGGGNSAELYDPVTAIWTNTGAMNQSRYSHTATLLPNGQVLVAGGTDGGSLGGFTNAEIYNPATGIWTEISGMNTRRIAHTATLLSNGTVLVAGGDNANLTINYLSSAEIYDPTTGQWTGINPMTTARAFHTATLLPNSQVLVTGGSYKTGGVLSSAEIYDPTTGQWTATNAMSTARFYHTATSLANGQVLVAGGNGPPGPNSVLSTAELYNPAAGTWTATSNSMTTARYLHTATALPNGQVLVAGGYNSKIGTLSSSETYSPNTVQVTTILLNNVLTLPSGAFQFSFTNAPGATFSVLVTTNLSLTLSNWTILKAVVETSPGEFQFTDFSATNGGQRFYCVHSP
jgi:N-acetylneuraminic acid mutarotase